MRRYAAAIGGLLFLACSSDTTITANLDAAVGVYVLQTVNGSPLPFDAGNQGGVNIVIVSDQYTLKSGGTYAREGMLRVTQAGITINQSVTESGTWSVNGSTVTLTIASSNVGQTGSYSGALGSSSLSLNQLGFVGVYSKT